MGRRSIAVQILGQEYRIASSDDPEAVEKIQQAAQLVDETMAKIRERTGMIDTQQLAVLAALNIANRKLGKGDATSGVEPARLQALIELVESATAPDAPTAH